MLAQTYFTGDSTGTKKIWDPSSERPSIQGRNSQNTLQNTRLHAQFFFVGIACEEREIRKVEWVRGFVSLSPKKRTNSRDEEKSQCTRGLDAFRVCVRAHARVHVPLPLGWQKRTRGGEKRGAQEKKKRVGSKWEKRSLPACFSCRLHSRVISHASNECRKYKVS